MADSWKAVPGIAVTIADPEGMVKLPAPGVKFRIHEASATRAPWVDSNAWRFLRQNTGTYYYDAPGKTAPLAAAEAFVYQAKALVHTDLEGLKPLGAMLNFLSKLDSRELPALVNINFIDDGSPESGELMNLLIRRNLLFRVVTNPAPPAGVVVKLGMPEYPRSEAGNPSLLAEKVRSEVTDKKRLLRIYGSEVVVGRLEGDEALARLYLLNYAAGRAVNGVRIRVLGKYPKIKVFDYGSPDESASDFVADSESSEFTLRDLKTFAVVELTR